MKLPDAHDKPRDQRGHKITYIDSLNAVPALLKRLQETDYKRGFLHGIPVEDYRRLCCELITLRRAVGLAFGRGLGQGAVKL